MPNDNKDNQSQKNTKTGNTGSDNTANKIGAFESFGIGAGIGAAFYFGGGLILGLGFVGGLVAAPLTYSAMGAITAASGSAGLATAAGITAGVGVFGASCYGTYKAGRYVGKKINNNERLDKTRTFTGAIAGFLGMAVLSSSYVNTADVDVKILDEDTSLQQNTGAPEAQALATIKGISSDINLGKDFKISGSTDSNTIVIPKQNLSYMTTTEHRPSL